MRKLLIRTRNYFIRLPSILPALALVVAISSAQAVCWIFINQPDVPESLRKYDD